ncbi:hypothetical protein [Paenibacillus sp. DMB5]|uniref:hypothetical protein n=1 Tax=Paenibacillus sp. DMB5 TaxID=1780103 RepID=UPI00076D05DA|nr:hypothetical protein [Paenibacillus sp. DMB5]KUP20880.1 hypothetical protein AWJ19_04580 [Paenibacillus sp. DMB5]
MRQLARQALGYTQSAAQLLEQDGAWLEQVYGASVTDSPADPPAAAGLEQAVAAVAQAGQTQAEAPDAGLLAELEARLASGRSRSAGLRSTAARWQQSMQEQQQLCHKEAAAVEAETTWLQGLAAKAEELAGQLAGLRGEWAALFPELAVNEAEAAYRAMQLKDEQSEEIRGRLEISVKFLEDKNTAVQALQEEITGLDKELAQLHAQLEGKEALEREKAQRLQQWTGGRPLPGCLLIASGSCAAFRLRLRAAG